jgi:hypothetical protein
MPYLTHPNIVTPSDRTVLWRYLDLARFMDILERGVLWFPRADQFEDPLEGTYTDAELNHVRSLASLKTPDGIEAVADTLVETTTRMRSTNFISCWRAGTDESMAMWDLYRQSTGVIAIRSTIGDLKNAVRDFERPVYIGEVKYVDWNEAPWDNNMLAMSVRKVLAYKHESEVRALIWGLDASLHTPPMLRTEQQTPDNPEGMPLGLEVPFNFQEHVTDVWIGPREEQWIVNLVKQIMKKYTLPQQVVASSLLQRRT